jgi:antitoxin component YwqK of YwqJK toxin-antitoxin module
MTSLKLLDLDYEDKLKGVWLSGTRGEGEFKRWYRNGKIWFHCYYKNSKLHGESKE